MNRRDCKLELEGCCLSAWDGTYLNGRGGYMCTLKSL